MERVTPLDPMVPWERELDQSVPLITRYWAVVRNMYCTSRSRLTAWTEEELWAKIRQGQRDRLYADVMESGEELVRDPVAEERAKRESFRIRRTTCRLPPPEDLLLVSAAKKADPADPEAIRKIDPSAGRWDETKQLLKDIRDDKVEQYWALQRARQHTP